MMGLPQTTPTAGIMHTMGSLFASVRVEQKQLLYLHKVLQRVEGHWTKTTLLALKEKDIGWARQADSILVKWGLERNWEDIRAKGKGEWKKEVLSAAEKIHVSRLIY